MLLAVNTTHLAHKNMEEKNTAFKHAHVHEIKHVQCATTLFFKCAKFMKRRRIQLFASNVPTLLCSCRGSA